MIIEQATIDDLPVILAMRQQASDWLAKQGINQWAAAWPTPEAQSERILSSIRAGETWMVRDDDGATAATVALDSFSDPKLWTRPTSSSSHPCTSTGSSSGASTQDSAPT